MYTENYSVKNLMYSEIRLKLTKLGGLGIRNCRPWNKATIGKHIWQFLQWLVLCIGETDQRSLSEGTKKRFGNNGESSIASKKNSGMATRQQDRSGFPSGIICCKIGLTMVEWPRLAC